MGEKGVKVCSLIQQNHQGCSNTLDRISGNMVLQQAYDLGLNGTDCVPSPYTADYLTSPSQISTTPVLPNPSLNCYYTDLDSSNYSQGIFDLNIHNHILIRIISY